MSKLRESVTAHDGQRWRVPQAALDVLLALPAAPVTGVDLSVWIRNEAGAAKGPVSLP